jgi:hypothetical protein
VKKRKEKKRKEKSQKKTKNSRISLLHKIFHEVVLIESNALETIPTSGTSF